MKSKSHVDLRLIIPAIILVCVSLNTLFSINIVYFKSQLISLIVGLIAYFFFSKMNMEFLRQLKLPIYIISLILLVIILGIGLETRGAVRWIDIFGVRLQFSEILKPFLALALASTITDGNNNIKSFFIIIALIIPVLLLIVMQPDLGNALLYAGVALFTLIVAGFPILWFLILFIPFLLVSPLLWLLLHDYQRQRIFTFLHASKDPLGSSYNGIQAVIAVGSGTFLGKGVSEGTQSVLRFLPERHTDFIFATIAEGVGFVGSSFVILAFLFLAYRIYTLFRECDDSFSKNFLAASFGFFVIQGFVNIAMNMGLLPIVGITLPFVSFGGSSLLSNFIFLGMISSLSVPKNKPVLEIR